MYKLFAFDIDGTLVNSDKQVMARTKQAMARLHEEGKYVVISSGRPFPGVKTVAEMVGYENISFASCFNGGLVKDVHTGENIVKNELSTQDVYDLVDLAKEYGVDMHFYDEKNVLTPLEPKFEYINYEEKLSGMSAKVISLDGLEIHSPKVMLTAPEDVLKVVEDNLDKEWYERFTIVKSEPYFLEFNPLGIDKGKSLAVLAEKLGVSQSEVMAFGDQNNDLSMIEWAGKGVAMGNAIASLKSASDYVTGTNDDEGIADALEALVFSQGL